MAEEKEQVDYEKAYKSLDKRYAALASSYRQLEEKHNTINSLYMIMCKEKAQWEIQKGVQSGIIQKQLGTSNKETQRLQEEIQDVFDKNRALKFEIKQLRAEIKRLKDGDID